MPSRNNPKQISKQGDNEQVTLHFEEPPHQKGEAKNDDTNSEKLGKREIPEILVFPREPPRAARAEGGRGLLTRGDSMREGGKGSKQADIMRVWGGYLE
ncbi:hypothetical protein HYFRA_00003139 [Hymenoscyphus fraxineus]|uniref:Uncharacterized protein n=1 Tax=Hymenoscyphus fraxineus TaxID=746836 RepID=A0A9N9KSS5_9HELO|nr:hypothetical protein HYFRA_00003139 [Hymenoscyphus fraxineus]